MTWRRRGIIAGAAALALGGAFLAGRASAPARVVERVQERSGEREARASAETSAASSGVAVAAAATQAQEAIRRIRIVVAPDGTQTTEATEETRAATSHQAVRVEERVVYRDRVETQEVVKWKERDVLRSVEARREALFSLGPAVRYDVAAQRFEPGLSAQLDLGPVEVEVAATTPVSEFAPAVMVSARWEF